MGELFQLKLLREKVVHQCIDKLLGVQDDDSIECLTKLLDTTGKDLDYSRKKVSAVRLPVLFGLFAGGVLSVCC